MRLTEPQKHIGCNVRMRPQDGNQHFGRGRLIAVEGDTALVQPFGRHRKLERFPLSDLHTWAAGNIGHDGGTPVTSETSVTERWIVADVENVVFFVSTWFGFKPELNRARIYDDLRSANRSAGALRRRRARGDVGQLEVLTVSQAEKLIHDRYHSADAPASPMPAEVPLPQPSPTSVPAFELTQATPDQLRLAADILRRMADAEAMYREASAELERVRVEWQQLQQKIAAGTPAEVAAVA